MFAPRTPPLFLLWALACAPEPPGPRPARDPGVEPAAPASAPARPAVALWAAVGVQAWIQSSRPLAPDERLVGVTLDGVTIELGPPDPLGGWWDLPSRAAWRVLGPDGAVLGEARVVPIQLEGDRTAPVLLDPDQALEWTLRWPATADPGLALYLAAVDEAGQRVFLNALGRPVAAPEPLRAAAGQLHLRLPARGGGLQTRRLHALLAPLGRPDRPLHQLDLLVVETGQRVAWGDLHSHTNLSMDACEDEEADCQPRDGLPGATALDWAERQGLDFLAFTEHAEHQTYTHASQGLSLDIWSESQAMVQAAEGSPVLALLGFEWTAVYEGGGHRTVLFEQPALCEDFRVSGAVDQSDLARPNGQELFLGRFGSAASTPALLEQALQQAVATCGPARWVAYYHHPALRRPRGVDWGAALTREAVDTVVEIYSEHGASECQDLALEGCDWRANAEQYSPAGSVRSALLQGLRLGFVGGSDNHQADPGDTRGTPSATYGHGGLKRQFAQGGLTGLWTPDPTALTREEVLDALTARQTLAASMPLERVQAVLLDDAGQPWLPGRELPERPTQAWLLVEVDDPALVRVRVELLGPDGALLATAEGQRVDLQVDLRGVDLAYVRLRLIDADGVEQRAWLSPWFFAAP